MNDNGKLLGAQSTPTPGYDPNEIVTLVGSKGTVKQVKRSELPQYNLPTDYISQADTYAKQIMSGNVAADSPNIPAEYRAGALQVLQRNKFTPEAKNELDLKQKSNEAKKVIKNTAQGVLDIIKQGEDGTLDPNSQEYRDRLAYATSDYNKRAFEEAGKAVTGPEKGIIQGTQIGVGQDTGNLLLKGIDLLTGYRRQATPVLQDSVDQVKTKMKAAIEASGGKAPEWTNKSVGPKVAGTNLTHEQNVKRGQEILSNIIPDAQRVVGGLASDINPISLLGFNPNIGDQVSRNPADQLKGVGQSFVNTFTNPEYNRQHPVEALSNVATIVGGAKALGGGDLPPIEAAPEAAAETPKTPVLPEVAPDLAKQTLKENAAGRAATSIGVPRGIKSVPEAEFLSKRAIQLTPEAKTVRDISRDLETKVIPDRGVKIKKWVEQTDKATGPMNTESTLDDVINHVSRAAEAKGASGQLLLSQLKEDLRGLLDGKGSEVGDTTWSRINDTRLKLNKDLERWYGSGRPTGTDATNYNALKYEAGRFLTNEMKVADQAGVIKQALEDQSVALQVYPDLAEQALSSRSHGGVFQHVTNALGNVIGEPAKIASARKLVGPNSDFPALPAIEAAPSAQMSTLPPIQNNVVYEGELPKIEPKPIKKVGFKRTKTGAFRKK